MTVRKMLTLTAGMLLLSLVSGSMCSDQQRCGDQQTCCQTQSGELNCCPFHQGECCEDHLHCCPEGMLCEVKESRCTNATHSLPWAERFPPRDSELTEKESCSVSDVPCDDTKACPDGQTCCKNEQGEWSCCPLPQAVCCEDNIHCCPHGTTCNLAAQKCDNSSNSVPWLKKEPSRPIGVKKITESQGTSVSDVPCDDTKACPDGQTCCKNEQGEWSCCPLPQAVCCEDNIHCCPHGTTCNLAIQKCDNSSNSVPWLKKEPSRPIGVKKITESQGTSVSDVPCDDTKACPDGQTCCKNEQGEWSCCPLPQAVCCEDNIHCCPHGTTCNLAAQKCDNSSNSVPWLKKEPSRPIGVKKITESQGTSVSDVPCDDTKACADGQTCCKNEQGGWSCCPLPQAVCCEDNIHCCPHGTTCNLAIQKCDNSSSSVPWLKKEPSRPIGDRKVPETKGSVPWLKQEPSRPTGSTARNTSVNEVKCDHEKSCPDHNTCCFMKKTNEWGCCPLDQATCCADGENCCPKGYTCRDQFCEKNTLDTAMPQVQTDIVCEDGSTCKDTETCCKMSETTWGCCPLAQAVCCSDMQHCCPAGYICDDIGSCSKAKGLDWEMFFSKKKRARAV